jgi:hypothetical protein
VDEFEQARSEDARYTLLMHDTRFASGGSYGVHHMLLSAPTMHPLQQLLGNLRRKGFVPRRGSSHDVV